MHESIRQKYRYGRYNYMGKNVPLRIELSLRFVDALGDCSYVLVGQSKSIKYLIHGDQSVFTGPTYFIRDPSHDLGV